MAERRSSLGFTLVLVLFVTAILMIVVLEFAHSMQVYATLAANNDSTAHLRGGLQGGVAIAEQLLLRDALDDAENDVTMDHLEEGWAQEIPDVQLEGVVARTVLEDESAKFPLSSLVEYQFEQGEIVQSTVNADRRRQLTALFDELGFDPALVDVLVDWMDVDDLEEPSGAEDSAYSGVGRVCRNGPLASVEELELLLGYTHEMVWGDPEDPDVLGLLDVCTVYGRPNGLVNANTASEPVLRALLPEDDLVRRVLSERDRRPFVDEADLAERVGDGRATALLTVDSDTWLARVVGTTKHEVRPLTMEARVVLRRERDAEEDDGGRSETTAPAVGGDDASAAEPVEAAATSAEPTRTRMIVLAWREIR